jgi:predicted RND superfamily exporter protein
MWRVVFGRYCRTISLIGWFLLPLVTLLGLKSLGSSVNEVRDWLPEGYQETIEYRQFLEHFGNDEYVLVSWEGCTIEDERLDQFSDRVRSEVLRDVVTPADGVVGRKAGLVRQISTGRSVLTQLMAPPLKLTAEEAVRRLSGTLIGADGRSTCAMLWLTPEARGDVHGTLSTLRQLLKASGVPPRDLRWAGAPVLNAELDAASLRSMSKAIILSCLIAIVIAWVAFNDRWIILMVLVTGFYSAALSLAVLPVCGVPMNSLLITMIPMVYTAGISGAIHMCNYYQEAVRLRAPSAAAVRAIECAWLPLALATSTTAAGLLSICMNDLRPVQQFGLFSAIGIGFSWILLVLWLPAALSMLRVGERAELPRTPRDEEMGDAPLPEFWVQAGRLIVRHGSLIAGTCLMLMAIAVPGVARLQITLDLLDEFAEDAEILRMGAWIEEHIGRMTSFELVLQFPGDNRLSAAERLLLTRRILRRLEQIPEISGSLSIASFSPSLSAQDSGPLQRAALNRAMRQQREQLQNSGFLRVVGGEEWWRINLRLPGAEEVDYNDVVREVRRQAAQELTGERFRGIRALCTGIAPVIYKARRSLVDGLIQGLASDVLLIVLAIVITMRTLSSGFLLLISSLFPTLLVLGTLGWLGIPINVGAVLAPCVALGVTVDDSIHFVVWFRNGVQRGFTPGEAVLLAWRACARPVYQSWMLLGLGMATQFVNDFGSIRQFGMMMVAMLTASVVGNLILQPAILSSPLGKFVARGFRRS